VLQASLDAEAAKPKTKAKAAAKKRHPATPKTKPKPPEPEPIDVIVEYQPSQSLRAWLQHRIDVIGSTSEPAKNALLNCWPTDLPPLTRFGDHTAEQLFRMDELLADIEKAHSVSFPTPRPGPPTHDEAVANVVNLFPGTTELPAKDTAT
jgi:hypothetical protein